jgi:DUF4097 and DUF4098 domain-containing protein YvlB
MIGATLLALALTIPAVQDTTLRLPQDGVVSIDAGHRGVLLRVVDGDDVTVRNAPARLNGREIRIDTEWPFGSRRQNSRIEVIVPARAAVRIQSISGPIEAAQVPQVLQIETVSGPIITTGGRGSLDIESVSSPIQVRAFQGSQLEIETMSGPVSIDGATGRIEVSGVSESLTFRNVRSESVHAESLNGRIDWYGPIDPRARLRFESHNGTVSFFLPTDNDVRFRVNTFLGRLQSSIPVTTRSVRDDSDGEQEVIAVLGKGSADVRVDTFNGNVVVRRIGDS